MTVLLGLGVYILVNKPPLKERGEKEEVSYPSFTETGEIVPPDTDKKPVLPPTTKDPEEEKERPVFFQLSSFPIAGATFLLERRPIEYNDPPREIKTALDPSTESGRKEIQKKLNEFLFLDPPLIVDGSFGSSVKKAIEDFQKINNLSVTGQIDEETSPFFFKTTTEEREMFEIVPAVRYVEKRNGHIYRKYLDNMEEQKISNSTTPPINDAHFNQTGDTVVYRYLSTTNQISSFIGTMGRSKGEYLPTGVVDISLPNDNSRLFYLVKNNNSIIGYTKKFEDTQKTQVFSSPFTEWLSAWDNNENVYLTSKASFFAEGSTYVLNTRNKKFTKLFGNILGLTSNPSPDGSRVLYSYSTNQGPKLGIFNNKDKSKTELDVFGLAEKCIWSNDNIYLYCALPNKISGIIYPDIWYQGKISFDDIFVEINTDFLSKRVIANSTDHTPIDAVDLFLDNEEMVLFMTNKKDSLFWGLNLY